MARQKRQTPEFIGCEFEVIVDSNEGAPYSFKGMSRRYSTGVSLPLIVPTVRKPLWCTDPVDIQIRHGKHVDTHRSGWPTTQSWACTDTFKLNANH